MIMLTMWASVYVHNATTFFHLPLRFLRFVNCKERPFLEAVIYVVVLYEDVVGEAFAVWVIL